jgi:hypothetical protein
MITMEMIAFDTAEMLHFERWDYFGFSDGMRRIFTPHFRDFEWYRRLISLRCLLASSTLTPPPKQRECFFAKRLRVRTRLISFCRRAIQRHGDVSPHFDGVAGAPLPFSQSDAPSAPPPPRFRFALLAFAEARRQYQCRYFQAAL